MRRCPFPADDYCSRDARKGFHVLREPLYNAWQIGLVCAKCGRRVRKRRQ